MVTKLSFLVYTIKTQTYDIYRRICTKYSKLGSKKKGPTSYSKVKFPIEH